MIKLLVQISFIVYLFFSFHNGLRAENRLSVNNIINNQEKEVLLHGGIITKCFLKNNKFVHSANTDAQMQLPETEYLGKDIGRYEMICVEKAFFPYKLTPESKMSIYNGLINASRLSGMKYYSKSDSKIETLIINSGRIHSPENRKPAKDAIFTEIHPKTVNYFTIKDNRFGNLTFRSELYNEGNSFILKNVCIDPMEKFFISINNKEEYRLISFFIYDNNAKGYFYCSINAMRIRADYFLKLGVLSAANFANRMRGSTVHTAKLLGLEWMDKIKAFE